MTTSESPAKDAPFELELHLSDTAVAKIREVMEQHEGLQADECNVRLFVDGGGCSGPSFGLAFDRRQDGDVVTEQGGLTILVDPASAPYVHGATVEFIETPQISGFRVTNPRLQSGCPSAADCDPDEGGCPPGCC